MGLPYLVAVVLHSLGLVTRNVYELLKRRGRIDPTDTRVFAVVFASMCIMWLSWFAVGVLAVRRLDLPSVAQWTGLSAVILGVLIAIAGMWQLGGVENIDHLVRTGVFSAIRHPMYVGFLLWILGWCAYTGAVTNLLLAPFGIASILWWRQLEESELALRYGDEYADYRRDTWF